MGIIVNILKKVYKFICNILKKILKGMVYFYRYCISPYKGGSCCKYTPTCSQYALEALEKYGPFKGSYLAIKRILRCNPFSEGGYDPVP